MTSYLTNTLRLHRRDPISVSNKFLHNPLIRMTKPILLEICCGSADDAIASQAGGADRIELNSSMFLGGLTPSTGSIQTALKHLTIPISVMIRPRGGGFCYTEVEYETMLSDADQICSLDVDGIVFGILNADGTIDAARCRPLIEKIKTAGKTAIFHRAFDVAPDPMSALETLIDLGIDRILTSGQKPEVPQALPLLKQLIETAGDRIEILPGAGIRLENALHVIEETQTTQIHLAATKAYIDPSCNLRLEIRFGAGDAPPESHYEMIDEEVVRKMKTLLSS